MEELCHCGHEVVYNRDWSDFDTIVNMLLVHFSKMKGWDAPTLGGLIQRALNGKNTSLLSSIKRMKSLETR